jgi:serine/threonine-protein kinase HipA
MTTLVAWRDATRVGVLDTAPNGEVRFTYDRHVVEKGDRALLVGLRCPLRAQPYVGPTAEAVFENLLPEGALRRELGQATKHDASDTVGLLGVVGGDCGGALQLWPEGTAPPAMPVYDPCENQTVRAAFSAADGQLRQVTGRASLSGAQAKLALWRMPPVGGEAPTYRLPRNGAPTTVVVKRPGAAFQGLLEAELVGMRLMAAAQVPTAPSARCLVAPDCHESARFDRVIESPTLVRRVHAEDGCQVTGRVSRNKYAAERGPTFQEFAALLDRSGSESLLDRETLFRWAVANAAIGNYDGHAKNLAFLYVAAETVRLAPAYDVVVTAVFPGLDHTFSLSFGGTTHPHALTADSLNTAAREFRMTPARARGMAGDVVRRVKTALPEVLHAVAGGGGDAGMLDRLAVSVTATVDDLASRLDL